MPRARTNSSNNLSCQTPKSAKTKIKNLFTSSSRTDLMPSGARAPLVQIADVNGDPIAGLGTFPVSEPPATSLYTEAVTSRTASGNTGNQTWPASVSSVFIGIKVQTLTGGTTPTLVVNLDQIDANGVFQTIASTPALNAVGSYNISVGDGQTIGATLLAGGTYRFSWVVTGAPTTLTFQIGMSGR